MKRLLASLLCLFLVLAAAACGAATQPQGSGTTPPQSASTTASATSAEPAASPTVSAEPTAEPTPPPTAQPSPSPAQLDLKAMTDRFQKEYPGTDMSSKPFFTMINAKDGVSFYIGDDVVKLYEYESKDVMDKAVQDFGLTEAKGFTRRGLLLLDTANKKAVEIFQR